jgi:hypothetical protein
MHVRVEEGGWCVAAEGYGSLVKSRACVCVWDVQEGKSPRPSLCVGESPRPSLCLGESKPKVEHKYAPSTRRFRPATARTTQRKERG